MLEYQYCPTCGKVLENKAIGELDGVPFCYHCKKPYLKSFPTSVIVSVINERQEVILLKRPYISAVSPVLITGKIAYGDSAETTVVKEVADEIGHQLSKIKFIKSYFHEKHDMLMLGFIASLHSREQVIVTPSEDALWCDIDAALRLVAEGSIAEKHLKATKIFCERQLIDPFDRLFETG